MSPSIIVSNGEGWEEQGPEDEWRVQWERTNEFTGFNSELKALIFLVYLWSCGMFLPLDPSTSHMKYQHANFGTFNIMLYLFNYIIYNKKVQVLVLLLTFSLLGMFDKIWYFLLLKDLSLFIDLIT